MPKRRHPRSLPTHTDGHPRKLFVIDGVDPGRVRASGAISVLIAYADKLGRAGLGALLDAEAELAVAGFAADGEEAVALTREVRPDVLLMDATLPGIDAAEATRRIVADPDTLGVRVLILGACEQDGEVLSSLRAGASGFLPRDTDPVELIGGVRAVAAGEAALSPNGVRRVIAELASQPDPGLPSPELLEELTAREREVMALVAAGLSNEQIAEHLVVAHTTAKTHVSRALGKLRARDRAQLVTLAYETGLVAPKHGAASGTGAAAATVAVA
jgi:DNA-binding NarL/FixJ family response regulator